MPLPKCSDEQFIEKCQRLRSGAAVAREIGVGERSVHYRRESIQQRYNLQLPFDKPDYRTREEAKVSDRIAREVSDLKPKAKAPKNKIAALRSPVMAPDDIIKLPSEWRYGLKIRNGTLVVASDAHYKPGISSTGHRATTMVIRRLKPKGVIANGDLFDASSVSRHFKIRWHGNYKVKEEVEACQERLGEWEDAAGGNCLLARTWGNHDSNFETRLSGLVPEYEGLGGFTLWEHLPRWQPCMSIFVNDGPGGLVIKHRYKGGMHATHNNTLWSGRSMATGHLHSSKVSPITDYNGTRYGVDSGCVASPEDMTFHYAEDDPRSWRSGGAVFTFIDGELMPPELYQVIAKNRVWFRGEVIDV